MTTKNILIAALAGAAAAAVIANYLGTAKGKQMLTTASGVLKDLTGKAAEFAKNNLTTIKSSKEEQPA